MGQTRQHFGTLFFTAIFSQNVAAIQWGQKQLETLIGPVLIASPLLDFNETSFYSATMGGDLRKQMFIFDAAYDPATLPDWKNRTNRLEEDYRQAFPSSVERPINVDPGYLSEAKLVLATTKDRDHRVYLRDGIYGEVTLYYLRTGWQFSRWTYPDYRRADVFAFLTKGRELLRKRIQESNA